MANLAPGIPDNFHDEFQAWVRLEPRARANDFARGLAARTADPLWMLARQWQTGEFDGEDTGSPIRVLLTHSTQALDRVRIGSAAQPTDLPSMPLETAVEYERAPLDWRFRVQIGQQFERFARTKLGPDAATLIDAYRETYALSLPSGVEWTETDRATRRFLRFMEGRVIDGGLLIDDVESGTISPPAGITSAKLEPVLRRLTDWYAKVIVQPEESGSGAWRNQQLDYRFEINPPKNAESPDPATDKTHIIAPDYRNGALDWYSFSAATSVQGEWQTNESRIYPTRISVGGTSPRWWAFEDAATDFGALDVATPDLPKLLLMDFVLIYGDDWFSVPLTVTMPSLVGIDELKVFNVFGEELTVDPVHKVVRKTIAKAGGDPGDPLLRWEMFALSPHPATDPDAPSIMDDVLYLTDGSVIRGTIIETRPGESILISTRDGNQTRYVMDAIERVTKGDVLLIPPVTGFREESRPLEAVHFLRDEGANRVWGVENTVLNGLGRPVHGFDAQRQRIERMREAEIVRLETRLENLEQQLEAGGLSDEDRVALEAEAKQVRTDLKRLRSGSRPAGSGVPLYSLATTVPENWIPFNPVNASPFVGFASGSIRLRRAQMLRNADDEAPTPILPMTRLLTIPASDPLLWLEEAAVPRSGVRLQLTAQRVRWVDGKTYVWLGRKVLTGRGEGASGLKFDSLIQSLNNQDSHG